MRKAEAKELMVGNASRALSRALRLSAVALGIGLLMSANVARAGDDDEDNDKTFEEKIIEGIMRGIGGTNMENTGIDYRERSPLVVPPKLDLPPPAASSAEVKAPNWPKDPDEARRKAAIAARKKDNKDPREASRTLTPSELNVGRTSGKGDVSGSDSLQPGGDSAHNTLSPSQLGYNGGFMGMFKGNTSEATQFKGEPTRQSLTQPPSGYQTPSPNYAYGTGPQQPLGNKQLDVMTGKER
jgi:hypothetical protein